MQAPKPKTKKQMMSFLGLCNYCRTWIPNYAEITRPMQDLIFEKPMTAHELIKWTDKGNQAFEAIKQCINGSTVLALPNYAKPFEQMVDVKNGFMTSILTQKWGAKSRPVAFYSTKLDEVAQATPHCVQAVLAAAMAVQASAEVVLFHPLTVKVPHAVSLLLLQTNMTFLSPARHLSCMTVLLSQPHITIERCTTLNPSTLLPTEEDGEPHKCLEQTIEQTKPRPDLTDIQLPDGEVVFVDGSAIKDPHGVNCAGYAVTTLEKKIEAKQLPTNYSAQAAELVALTRACELFKNKQVTIYTDSQYAFSASHVFCTHWKRRGYRTTNGKPVKHKELLLKLYEAIKLPAKVAICKCQAHTQGQDEVSKGNALADKWAKKATGVEICTLEEDKTSDEILQSKQQQATAAEKLTWTKQGCTIVDGIYVGPEGKPVLPKSMYQWAAIVSHGLSHVSTGGMCALVHKHYTAYGFNAYSKHFCQQCMICTQHNAQGYLRPKRGSFPTPPYPFHTIHMDFIQLNKVFNLEYVLVVIDVLSKWVELFPCKKPDAETVAKALCRRIIPVYGVPKVIRSDNGSHFVNKTIDLIGEHFKMDLKRHSVYHPQSAGLVERYNGTVKNKLSKVMAETRKPWPECLDIVQLSLRITPHNDNKLTPFEVLFGRPYYLPDFDKTKASPNDDSEMVKQLITLLNGPECVSANTVPLSSVSPQDKAVKPGDWVFLKVIKRKCWSAPRWEGPYQVVLATPTAVKVKGKATWIHLSHCKTRNLTTEPPAVEGKSGYKGS